MRALRNVFAAALVISLAAACRAEDRGYMETPPAEEEVDIRTLEEPAPAPAPQPQTTPAPRPDTMPGQTY